jgi:hypothetical protein
MRSGRGGPKVIVFFGMLMSMPEMSLSQLALMLYGIEAIKKSEMMKRAQGLRIVCLLTSRSQVHCLQTRPRSILCQR